MWRFIFMELSNPETQETHHKNNDQRAPMLKASFEYAT